MRIAYNTRFTNILIISRIYEQLTLKHFLIKVPEAGIIWKYMDL